MAAAKVFLETAIHGAPLETNDRALRAGLYARSARHYVVRFRSGGPLATRGVDVQFGATSRFLALGRAASFTWGNKPNPSDGKKVQTELVIEVRLATTQGRNIAVSQRNALERSTFEFSVVNGSVTHCIWRRPADRQ